MCYFVWTEKITLPIFPVLIRFEKGCWVFLTQNVPRESIKFHNNITQFHCFSETYLLYLLNKQLIMRIRNKKGEFKTQCSKCNKEIEENRVGKYRYCLCCHNDYMKKNRKKHSQLTEEQKLKANCRSYVNVYIRRGKIIPKPCIICENEHSEAHHEDYSKPLDIIWLCRQCHLDYHKGLITLNKI